MKLLAIAALALASTAAVSWAEPAAILRGLDKRTGKAVDFAAPIGRTVAFPKCERRANDASPCSVLEITARRCVKSAPEDTPEVSIFIEVADRPAPREEGGPVTRQQIFSGWVFASSPALNAVEHSTYDVWAIDCKT